MTHEQWERDPLWWWLEKFDALPMLMRREAMPTASLSQLVSVIGMGAGFLKKQDELARVDSHLPGFARDGYPSVPPMIEADVKIGLARAELPQELFDEIQFMRQE